MPRPYSRIAREIVPGWEISLAFVSPKTAQALNKRLRGKSYTPNVLAYPVGTKHGEVIICKQIARHEAPAFGLSYADFTLLLFIHALLHLKGLSHGTTMEKRERALLARFTRAGRTYGSSHHYRDRHRHLPSKGRRR
ncbi:rRNA maturation RNase YbeY [Candidatus Kaiserbacteria bacterium RIFCSPLOWO2_02_FULL_56_11]|uniref:rRNA maturation RNase YbeY n=2 Tax=Candidatus Kaiseribacteriota TaxID=1752734 RepID=A0A1F6E624_9BACT|nr:MAG: rRNA maturation RNase YbeY [Candidatus Kaiserbacteria bacterium RIFCSPHIGHO2_02_FULL_56_30]OGG71715.1 MAG: rRNA maturation RNase YbeY [Candidatus Kaiserbacteria bacterium RIFCSPHIGHO2_12_FULL_56_13]OGG81231.1 MAG: rRNA maturation RNase YbeY [Candidatus Kaiserbacteria bacterium RIFCSPLOWO2_02_FULL_56_11]